MHVVETRSQRPRLVLTASCQRYVCAAGVLTRERPRRLTVPHKANEGQNARSHRSVVPHHWHTGMACGSRLIPARRFSLFFHPTELVVPETMKDLLAVSRRLLARHSHGCTPCSPRSPAIASAGGHSCERHRARSAVLRSPRMAVRRAYGIFR